MADKLLSLRFDAVQDRDLIEYLDTLGKGNVSKVIKAAIRGYRLAIQNDGSTAPCNTDCNTSCTTPVLQADADEVQPGNPVLQADNALIVQGFEWKDRQDQARHDTLLAALDNLAAALSKLQVTGVAAPAPTPAPSEEPGRVSDDVLSKRAERMKRAAWAS